MPAVAASGGAAGNECDGNERNGNGPAGGGSVANALAAGEPRFGGLSADDPTPGASLSDARASRLIVALDTADIARAVKWAAATAPHVAIFKLGLEFFLAHGAAGVRALAGRPIFLDLKLHDIPNTVAGGVRAVLPLAPRMLTIHAAGGPAMIAAARNAAETAGPTRPMILAVTVLTSLDTTVLAATGVSDSPADQVLRLGRLALAAGADGLVCSPHEVAMLRKELGPHAKLVVPGIRPAGSAAADQARIMTPRDAVAAGADWIVVGRPITEAADPAAAAAAINAAAR
jgi:orotidine-5'-phosphate decarboxylase